MDVVDLAQGAASDNAVCGQTVFLLESLDGSGGFLSGRAGNVAGIEAQILQLALDGADGAGGDAPVGGGGFVFCGFLGGTGLLRAVDAVQLVQGGTAQNAVGGQTVFFLECLDGAHRLAAA